MKKIPRSSVMKYLLEAYQSSYHMAWESALASPDYPVAATSMGYIPTYKACLQHLYTKPTLCVRSLPWCTRIACYHTMQGIGRVEQCKCDSRSGFGWGMHCTLHYKTCCCTGHGGGGGERLHRSIKVNGHANSYIWCSHTKNTFSVTYGYKYTCTRIGLLHY